MIEMTFKDSNVLNVMGIKNVKDILIVINTTKRLLEFTINLI